MIIEEDIFTQSSHDTLIIPQGLKAFKDVDTLMNFHKNSGILHKNIKDNLINVEFYTQSFTIVFNCSGRETITSYDFDSVQIEHNELLFLPKDMYLISDFIKTNKNLEAYLFFFDDTLIDKFLLSKNSKLDAQEKKVNFYKMEVSTSVNDYIKSLKSVCKHQNTSKESLELKLLELLYIIDANDKDSKLITSLLSSNINKDKRNIISLMKKYYLKNFSIKDFALLSGRSLSSFHRDFKSVYDITPKQYLLNLKLSHALLSLEDQSLSVSDISSDLGYENTSHFIKAFKNKFGFTPKQSQKNHL